MDINKIICKFLVLLLLSFANGYGKDYKVNLDWQRDKQDYTQKVIVRDGTSNELIKEIPLSDSNKKEALVLKRGDTPYVFCYTEPKSLKGPKGLVQIINLDTLTISQEIVIDKITHTKIKQNTHTYMSVTKDGKHLVAQIGKGKNQRLINIDGKTGKIIKSIKLGRGKILVKNETDNAYIWTRHAKKSRGSTINLYDSNTLEFIRDIFLYGKFISISHYKNYIFIKEKFLNSKEPEKKKFNLKIVNIDKKKLYKDFTSSALPKEFVFSKETIYLVGRSIKQPRHLLVVKFKDEVFTDISNKSIDAIPEVLKGYEDDNEQILMVFGKESVVKFDILAPPQSKKIQIPFKIEGGIVSKDKQKVYVLANFGAKIGLADFEKGQFVGSDHTGSKAKKVGNVLFNLAVMAATAPTGYVLTPGFKLSNNALMLSLNQKLLFAINTKTNDVSIFNANDLSNKKIYPTGSNTFKIFQAGHKKDLPVVVISQRMVSFFDSNSGELIHKQEYDHLVKTTNELDLLYIKDKQQRSISLYNLDKVK